MSGGMRPLGKKSRNIDNFGTLPGMPGKNAGGILPVEALQGEIRPGVRQPYKGPLDAMNLGWARFKAQKRVRN